jgi:catechol 2,3-dioxygenase-like lactoylglutathione lyase family enzyme
MYNHIGIRVRDLDTASRFYESVLKPLGHVAGSRGDSYAGFGPKGAPALWLHLEKKAKPEGCHVAFQAPDCAAVDRFYAAGLKAGGKDNGKPGLRKDYADNYYAAFLIDPDGNNIEAVCML